jgi:hypothetical protein
MPNSLGCNRQGAPSISQVRSIVNTQVYLHKSFGDLTNLLLALKVVGGRRHRISHAAAMMGGILSVPNHWMPIPVVGLYQEYFEFVSLRK